MTLNPCRCCGVEPEVSFHPTPYKKGCWHVACKNDACDEKPSTWFYYKRADAEKEWNDLEVKVPR